MPRNPRFQLVFGLVALITGMSIYFAAARMESKAGRSTPTTSAMVYVGLTVALVGGGLAAFLTRGR